MRLQNGCACICRCWQESCSCPACCLAGIAARRARPGRASTRALRRLLPQATRAAARGAAPGKREHRRRGAGCMSLERLEDFVRQMVGQAPTRLFVQTLLVLDRAEHQSAEAKAKIVDKVAAASGASPAAVCRA